MSEMHHFPKISYVSGNIRVDINFDRFEKQFQEAQRWLGDRVLEDCKAVMPFLNGNLQQRSKVLDNGRRVVFEGPYARYLYGGKVMVDKDTGNPWARQGNKKILTDRKLTYSRAEATDHWFDTAKEQNGEYWIREVKRIAGGG